MVVMIARRATLSVQVVAAALADMNEEAVGQHLRLRAYTGNSIPSLLSPVKLLYNV